MDHNKQKRMSLPHFWFDKLEPTLVILHCEGRLCLADKNQVNSEVTDSEKHSSLLWFVINKGHAKFYSTGLWIKQGILRGGEYHCTVALLFDWFGISCITTDNFRFYLQTSQTGGQWYSDTSPLQYSLDKLWK